MRQYKIANRKRLAWEATFCEPWTTKCHFEFHCSFVSFGPNIFFVSGICPFTAGRWFHSLHQSCLPSCLVNELPLESGWNCNSQSSIWISLNGFFFSEWRSKNMVFPIFCCRMKIPISGEFCACRGGQRRRQRRCERGDRRGLRPRGYPLRGARGGWPGAGHGGGTLGVEPTLGGRCEGGVNNQPLGTWHLAVGVFFGEGRTLAKMGRWLKMTFYFL